jgi:DNA-binding beta-propeller fold protein YncE
MKALYVFLSFWKMKAFIFSGSFLFLVAFTSVNSSNQTTGDKTLSKNGSITLAGVTGRIDHMAFDSKRQFIYVAALGNNTVEVIDLKNKKFIHSIKGMSEPQGIRYIPESNAIFIANGNTGECDVIDADSYKKIGSVKLESDADNVRYDSGRSKVYVGYGEGGIAIIDAKSFKQLADIKLPGHPESFQLDTEDGKLFVNVPDSKILAIIDLTKNTVTDKWKIEIASANFPLALDSKNHRLFIGCRNPAKLLVLNSVTGKTVDVINIDADTDDIFYDSFSKQIFVSCGNGYIDAIEQIDPDKYGTISRIESLSGARTSLLGLNQLIIASPARAGREAQLMIYEIKQ